jgi:Right handed beta helix region
MSTSRRTNSRRSWRRLLPCRALGLLGLALTGACQTLRLAPAGAATYYVSTGGRDENPGTADAPFATIQKGIDRMAGGDTLALSGGTYAQTFTIPASKSGTEGHPTTITSAAGETARVKPTTGHSAVGGIVWNQASFVTLRGLVLDGDDIASTSNLVYTGDASGPPSHHVLYEDLTVENLHGQGSACLTLVSSAHDLTYRKLTVRYCGKSGVTAPQPGEHGLYITAAGMTVEGCDISHNYNAGIQIYSGSPRSTVIRDNDIHDNGGPGLLLYTDPTPHITRNRIYRNGSNPAYGGAYGGIYDNVSGAVILQNTLADNTGYGILFDAPAGAATTVQNNIFWGNQTADYRLATGSAPTLSYNLCAQADGERCAAPGDPQFVNAAGGDFHLTAGSPAIDKGMVPEGVAPPGSAPGYSGSAPDLGAWEYTSAPPTPTPPHCYTLPPGTQICEPPPTGG